MDLIYDARLDKCPLPLVKLRQMLKKMQNGDHCIIQIADPGSKKDIPKLLKKYGYVYSESVIHGSVIELRIPYREQI